MPDLVINTYLIGGSLMALFLLIRTTLQGRHLTLKDYILVFIFWPFILLIVIAHFLGIDIPPDPTPPTQDPQDTIEEIDQAIAKTGVDPDPLPDPDADKSKVIRPFRRILEL